MAAAAPSDDLFSPLSHARPADVHDTLSTDQQHEHDHAIAEPTSTYSRLQHSHSITYSSRSVAVSTSSSTSPTVAAGPSVRRQSTQDRLNDILATARQRAESVSAQAQASASEQRPNTAHAASYTTFRMDPLLRNQSAPGAFGPEQLNGGDGHSSQRSARHLHYAASAGTYGALGLGQSRSRKSRKSLRSAARDPGEAAAVGAGAASQTASVSERSGAGPAELPWWRAWLSGFQSIELENKGSVARDHLALERTFLAWLRTSLAFASIGVAVTQLFRLNTATSSGDDATDAQLRRIGLPLGSTFLGISVLILFLGYHRFYQSQQWILKGKYSASRGTILLVSLVAFALMVTSLVIVVVVQPSG